MITKLDNGLFLVECANTPRYPNANGVIYNLEDFNDAVERTITRKRYLTNTDQTTVCQDTSETLTVRLESIIGEVVETNYESDEPHMLVKSWDGRLEEYVDQELFAGVRGIGYPMNLGGTKYVDKFTIICWDLVPVSNWKNK